MDERSEDATDACSPLPSEARHQTPTVAAEDDAAPYRAMFESGRTIAAILTWEGVVLRASPGWSAALGHPVGAPVGTRLASLLHPEDEARLASRSPHRALACLDRTEARVASSDGSFRRFAFTLTTDEARGLLYAVAHDVTDLRRAQRAAEEARKQAVAASRVKSRFLANMSHEIRTPMNGILGMLRIALDGDLSQAQREPIACALQSAETLLVILSDILDLSKIEAGKLALEDIPFRIRETLGTALAPLVARALEKGIGLTIEVDPEVSEVVTGDPGRFRQVALNLVSNAVKFTESGGVRVRVRTSPREPSMIHVSVADTGVGIPADRQARVFGAFRQADESTTRHFGGTGLGLAISRELTSLMGGRIWLESTQGVGSTFHFTVRLPSASDDCREGPATASDYDPNLMLSLRVLLAEDNAVGAKIARRLLEKHGCDVVHADTGAEAVKLASQQPFDVVLMDIQMPVMDGFEAARRLRASGSTVPIFALTANAMTDDARRCLAAGMNGHLAKPIDPAAILRVLESQIAKGTESAPPDAPPAPTDAVDIDLVRRRCDNDRELLAEVAEAFRDSWRDSVGVLERAFDNGDAEARNRTAHLLRGSFLYVGAESAAGLAEQLERLPSDATPENGHELLARLRAEAARVESALVQSALTPAMLTMFPPTA